MVTVVARPQVELPERVYRLDELGSNLWWFWHPDAAWLYRSLDQILWDTVEWNPVLFLRYVNPERLQEAANDPRYGEVYDRVMERFDALTNDASATTWVGRNEPSLISRPVAYFSAEFGLHPSLPIYSGGLGVLAGDHIKTASDLGLPLFAVSLLYRQGYLKQVLDASGWQQDVIANLEPWAEPTTLMQGRDGRPLIVEVPFEDPANPVKLAVWCVQVGRVPLFLLDADVEGNPDWTRTISSRLYGGDVEHRLRQEIILGIGGVRALRAVGLAPAYWHANEGHAAFSMLERVRELAAAGEPFDDAAEAVKRTTVFTSHTPVPAGHDVFPSDLMDRYFWHYWGQLGLDREQFLALGRHGDHPGFNMTALSMRLADHRNAVSARHGEVTRQMWHDLWPGTPASAAPITHITNGVHLPTWISPAHQALYDRYLPADWRDRQEDPEVWEGIANIPDRELWDLHLAGKNDLLEYLREYTRRRWAGGELDPGQVMASGIFLEPEFLTIGFARRFATYKRATLIFSDVNRLARIVNNAERPVQIVFAGKAHPADDGGKHLIRDIYWKARDPRFNGRIAFAENYDMAVAAKLYAGVDVWLNNPRAPLEASGTSGMKAAANGAPNLSILDGWWLEGWDGHDGNGWGIHPHVGDEASQNRAEAEAIYDAIEHDIVPRYYEGWSDCGVPERWLATMKAAIRTNAPAFSAQRMVIDYVRNLYLPASRGSEKATETTGQPG
ncbi:MAG: alpha-glucan family phosphorylase [Chloroflexota bacterium]